MAPSQALGARDALRRSGLRAFGRALMSSGGAAEGEEGWMEVLVQN